MSQHVLTGTGVAIITPFREDGSIDFTSLEKLLQHITHKGIDFIVVLGTTGESVTLSEDEKKAVVNFVLDAVDKRISMVMGMGGNNTQDVINSIKKWDFDGISAILSVAPYYNKPSQKGLFMHFKSIAEVSPVPVIIYNVPSRTGSDISAETTVKLAREVKSIIAVKEASGNMRQIMDILKSKPKNFQVLSGDDMLTLPMITLGGSGVISVTANAFPQEFSDMVRFARAGELEKACELHYRMLDLIQAVFAEGSPAGIKAALAILGISGNHLRLPLLPVSEEHGKKIASLVKKLHQ